MKRWISLFLLCFTSIMAVAQSGSTAIIEYIEGDFYDVLVTRPDGVEDYGDIGMEIELESTIRTGEATVEIRLEPNGTILNLDRNTLFELTSIQGTRNSEETVLTLLQGRLRTVAARNGMGNRYSIKTPTAVCGIRGTEILNTVSPGESSILCKTGSVEVINALDSENRVLIGPNQMVNTQSVSFTPAPVSDALLTEAFESLPFRKLIPEEVPSIDTILADAELAEPEEENPELTEPGQEEPQAEEPGADVPEAIEEPEEEIVTAPVISTVPTAEDTDDSTDSGQDEPGAIEQWFRDSMGFEIGTVTIDGETWAKVVAQPVFSGAKLKTGLYLPVIYKSNLMDPSDWYRPEGNDEWSFGSDQDGWDQILLDINKDFWLKIRFMEYGDPLWDPFYLHVGNLNNMTIGHGSLIKDYTNNINFPSQRKTGINTGVTFGGFKIEALVDDTSNTSLAGARIQFAGAKGPSFALASVADFYVASELDDPSFMGDPMLIAASLDSEIFKINTDLLKLMYFADLSVISPYFRTQPETLYYGTFDHEDYMGMFWDGSELHNYGAMTGVKGSIARLNFELDLRYENGLFQHQLFNSVYERNRLNYMDSMIAYLASGSTETTGRLALYGSADAAILSEKVRLQGSYLWPWDIEGSKITLGEEDYLKLGLIVDKGLIPVYDISGAFYYERIGFAQSIMDNDFDLLNAQTVLSGEMVMPLAPTLDLAVIASTSTVYDDNGNLILNADGNPKIVPVFNIETRIHF